MFYRFLFALVGCLSFTFWCPAATVRSQNFAVTTANQQFAEKIAQWGEYYRKEKALLWFGKEMAQWRTPCPIKVTVSNQGAGGATSFEFDGSGVSSQDMHIEGTEERLVKSVLPHEITHTVFAYFFRRPLPRWADEGAAVLSEDESERRRHDQLCRDCLNQGRSLSVSRLFALDEYPRDVMVLYAEGYCITNFLVDLGGRQRFVAFLGTALEQGWDRAAGAYNYRSTGELEQAWLNHMKSTKGHPLFGGSASAPSSPSSSLPSSVSAPSSVSPDGLAGDSGSVLQTLARIESKLDQRLIKVESELDKLKARVDGLEKQRGATLPSWNDPPVRVQPVPQQVPAQRPLPVSQPIMNPFANPQPYVPSQICPTGH